MPRNNVSAEAVIYSSDVELKATTPSCGSIMSFPMVTLPAKVALPQFATLNLEV